MEQRSLRFLLESCIIRSHLQYEEKDVLEDQEKRDTVIPSSNRARESAAWYITSMFATLIVDNPTHLECGRLLATTHAVMFRWIPACQNVARNLILESRDLLHDVR